MTEFLVIRLGDSQDSPANWIAVDSSGARQGPPVTGPLGEAIADIGERTVIVLVPGAEVLTTTVDIPVKGARLQAALPFALEEVLADDVEDLHFSAGNRRDNGAIPVTVVARSKFVEWLSWLEAAAIAPTSVVPDCYGLARIPGTISLLVAEDQVMINDGADVELLLQSINPSDALEAIGAFHEQREEEDDDDDEATVAQTKHVLVYCDPLDEERFQHDWIAIRQAVQSLDIKLLPDGVLPRLASTVASGAGVNLLQREFAVKTEYSGLFRPWKYAAMLLAAFLVVGAGGKAADFYRLSREEADLKSRFQAEYQKMAPGAPEVLDPVAVINSYRNRSGGGNAEPQVFLQSMQYLGRAMNENSDASVAAISYRAGVTDIRLTAPSVATLDNIQRMIDESGKFSAAIQSTDQDGESVNSRIQIRGADQ